MKEEIVRKYVKDLDGLKNEVESFKERYLLPEEKGWEELLPIYHETVVFFFSLIYKYLVFEDIPIFSGGQGLDAWIGHKEKTIINVEFEVLSSDFLTHSDEEKKECNMIVCWKDNSRKEHEFWKHIEIFELRHFWE